MGLLTGFLTVGLLAQSVLQKGPELVACYLHEAGMTPWPTCPLVGMLGLQTNSLRGRENQMYHAHNDLSLVLYLHPCECAPLWLDVCFSSKLSVMQPSTGTTISRELLYRVVNDWHEMRACVCMQCNGMQRYAVLC